MNKQNFDIIIIGAGIIGSMTARYLSKYKLDILLIEKECDIGTGASSSNSGIIHSGHDPKPGSLKAELNFLGNKLWPAVAKELDIPFKKTGSYVVAIGEDEFIFVKKLYERAILNGVSGIEVLKKNEILYREPKINPKVTGALWTPSTGVIDSFIATVAACENAVENGVKLLLNTEFQDFIFENNSIIGIKTNHGKYFSNWVINCAGLYSDEVMHKAGIRKKYKIIPRRGEYLIFDASKVTLNTVLYPVPTDKGKGTLVSTTTHGNVMIGPNALFVDDKTDKETTREGLEEIAVNAKKLVPDLKLKDVIASFAGLRARSNSVSHDFIIETSEKVKGLINLAGIESPGLASAPAIAKKIIKLLKNADEKLVKKEKWKAFRTKKPRFKELSHRERQKLVKKNPSYGRIICRCEEVTEGEILDAIHSPVPATTYDAIKRRTWLGTGRCQGAFDFPRVFELLSRELNISIMDITKKGKNSSYIFRKTKDVEDDKKNG